MSEPRVVTPQEAAEWLDLDYWGHVACRRLSVTVATEPDRTRAAERAGFIMALTQVMNLIDLDTSVVEKVPPLYDELLSMRTKVEDGADYA